MNRANIGGKRLALIAGSLLTMLMAAPVAAGETRAAVAANFIEAAEELAAEFERQTGHHVGLSAGSTGGLFAQISQGAPFEVLLAADKARARQAVADGLAVAGTVITYAVGELVLYSPILPLGQDLAVLAAGEFERLAIADPQTAPYGAAALQVLQALGLEETLRRRLVIGESVGQALLFVETGNAELGLVALSQVFERPERQRREVPAGLYLPIEQDAVLLANGADNPAARGFLDFLASDDGRAIIERHGYGTVP